MRSYDPVSSATADDERIGTPITGLMVGLAVSALLWAGVIAAFILF